MTALVLNPVDIQATLPGGAAYVGEWVPLLLAIKRSGEADGPVRIRNVTCDDTDVQLDLDLLDRETALWPGEAYRLTLPIRVLRPKVFGLGHIELWVRPEGAVLEDPVRLPAGALDVRPAIGTEIDVSLEPLCQYEQGVKVLVTLRHVGATTFRNLTVNLLPELAIRTGKRTMQRGLFQGGETVQAELVIAGSEIDVVLTADVDGQRPEARHRLVVAPPAATTERRFRFLEPRRLSTDLIGLSELGGDKPLPVEPVNLEYPLHGGSRYELVIRPQRAGITRVHVRDIPNVINVHHSEQSEPGKWVFRLDATFNDLLRKQEVIYYDVESRGERLTGEVPVCLAPPRLRHWQVAGALGVALTVQGIAALGRFLHHADYDLTSLATEFNLREDYNLLFLLSVPVSWGLIRVVDWLQYRLRG